MLDLERKPPRAESHHYADWVELKTLISNEGEVNRSDLAKDLGIIFDLEGGPEDSGDSELDEEVEPGAARYQTKIDGYLEDAIRQIERRTVDFSQFYPFELSEDRRTIRKLRTSKSRDTYLALLLASCKRWVGQSKVIEDAFEELSFHAVKGVARAKLPSPRLRNCCPGWAVSTTAVSKEVVPLEE